MNKIDKSGFCAHCGTWRKILQRDHIVPKHKGGGNELTNIQWLCANCHQDKTVLEMSAVFKGKPKSPEHIAKISAANTGRKVSEETKAKIRASVIATLTPERLEQLREGYKRRVYPNGYPWTGKRRSEETKAKISAAHIKRHLEHD